MDSADLDSFLNHRSALIDYAAPIVGCRALAEDIVHEAFLRCSSQKEKRTQRAARADAAAWFDPFTVPYLRQVVRNLAIDWRRRRDSQAEIVDGETLDAMPAESAGPEQAAISGEEIVILAGALAELPERTRLAFQLYWLEGRSLKEVAATLGVSIVRVHQLVRDAVCHGAGRLDQRKPR